LKSGESLADGDSCLSVGGVEEMGVGPECGARVGVAEPAGNGPDANAASGESGGGEMAEGGEGDVGQLEAVPQGSEGTGHPVGSVRGGAVEALGPDAGGGREADVGHGSPLDNSFPVGSKHLDGRKHARDKRLDSEEALGAPPPEHATSQRMSPPGISFFYAALDQETCLAELRGVDGEMATVARWVTQRPCWVVNLDFVPDLPSIFDPDGAPLRSSIIFLQSFTEEIRHPVRAHDNPAVDYVPTQAVAEYIRHVLKSDDGRDQV
jgi:RES domain